MVDYVEQAKVLLREQLSKSADEGVRTLAMMSDLADDDPAVTRIAAALRARNANTERGVL